MYDKWKNNLTKTNFTLVGFELMKRFMKITWHYLSHVDGLHIQISHNEEKRGNIILKLYQKFETQLTNQQLELNNTKIEI